MTFKSLLGGNASLTDGDLVCGIRDFPIAVASIYGRSRIIQFQVAATLEGDNRIENPGVICILRIT